MAEIQNNVNLEAYIVKRDKPFNEIDNSHTHHIWHLGKYLGRVMYVISDNYFKEVRKWYFEGLDGKRKELYMNTRIASNYDRIKTAVDLMLHNPEKLTELTAANTTVCDRRIICTRSGRIYNSVQEAIDGEGVNKCTLSNHLYKVVKEPIFYRMYEVE